MPRLNPNKLKTLKNFSSIWNNEIWNTSPYVLEDLAIRKFIEGTLQKYIVDLVGRKVRMRIISDIIIKRKVNNLHIVLQHFSKTVKKRKRVTKNRLKNRIKYREKMLALRRSQKNTKFHSLYFCTLLIHHQLQKLYPNNKITLYIQQIKHIELNSKMIADWMVNRCKKKRSYKRLISIVTSRFARATEIPISRGKLNWWKWDLENQKVFFSWFTKNCLDFLNFKFKLK